MEPNGVAYDASQIEMRYSGEPSHVWHPAALLRVLADGCAASPFQRSVRFSSRLERRVFVSAAAARLGERGFDVDELIRCVFRTMYVGEFLRLGIRLVFDSVSARTVNAPEDLRPLAAWLSERIEVPDHGESFTTYFGRTVRTTEVNELGRRVAGWISQAELLDLLAWRLPETGSWGQMPVGDVGSKVCQSQWMADRFLLTFVEDWHTASLHEEFRWNAGDAEPRIPSEMMGLRAVPQDRLNAEIARRAVEGDPHGPR